MILGTKLIRERLENGEIFREHTWTCKSIKEASYALRVAPDGMIIDGEMFGPGKCYPLPFIEIKAGRIAILSTQERLCMPGDLAGQPGVRLDFASRGLTGLMGIQVDPYYGSNHEDERLFIKVANFGNESVIIYPGEEVFNIVFWTVEGATNRCKDRTWDRIKKSYAGQQHFDWTHVAKIEADFTEKTKNLNNYLSRGINTIRDNQQSVVMFGVFLVAITILAGSIGLIINVENTPIWMPNVGWIILLILCTVAVVGMIVFLWICAYGFYEAAVRGQEADHSPTDDPNQNTKNL